MIHTGDALEVLRKGSLIAAICLAALRAVGVEVE